MVGLKSSLEDCHDSCETANEELPALVSAPYKNL